MTLARHRSKDITQQQFLKQLQALGCSEFALGVKNEQTQKMATRRSNQTVDDLMQSIRWLKYMNFDGHHIYVRPEQGEAVVLVDDVSVSQLLQMDRDGIHCACVVETSDLNFQAWVRVSNDALAPNIATCLGEILASRYNGDLGSKDFRHFGRAVGFTNVKPRHRLDNGLFPFTKIVEAQGGVTTNAAQLIEEAIELSGLKERERQAVRRPRTARDELFPEKDVHVRFTDAVDFIVGRYGRNTDASRADASAALHLLFEGFSRAQIEKAMLCSEDVLSRHPKIDDYVRRTLDWACDRGKVETQSKR